MDTKKENSISKQCAYCKSNVSAKSRCSRCKKVNYCSQVCQREDWKNHKLTCCTSSTKRCQDTKKEEKVTFENVIDYVLYLDSCYYLFGDKSKQLNSVNMYEIAYQLSTEVFHIQPSEIPSWKESMVLWKKMVLAGKLDAIESESPGKVPNYVVQPTAYHLKYSNMIRNSNENEIPLKIKKEYTKVLARRLRKAFDEHTMEEEREVSYPDFLKHITQH